MITIFHEEGGFRPVVFLSKLIAAGGPFPLIAILCFIGFYDSVLGGTIAIYGANFLFLISDGFIQRSKGLRESAGFSFGFAVVALLWTLVSFMVLPALG